MANSASSKEVSEFTGMKNNLITQLQIMKSEGVKIWRETIAKNSIIDDVVEELIKVHEMGRTYIAAPRLRTSLLENVRTCVAFRKVDETFELLETLVKKFSQNINQSQAIFRGFLGTLRSFFDSCEKVQVDLDAAETCDALEKIEIPNLKWLDNMEDAEMDLRVEEWETMNLIRRYSKILEAMVRLSRYL